MDEMLKQVHIRFGKIQLLQEVTAMVLAAMQRGYTMRQFAEVYAAYTQTESVKWKAFEDQVKMELADGRSA